MIEEIANFGTNNLTYNMELVVVRADSLQEIIDSPIYHLNPSAVAVDSGEIFAVKGTAEQYAQLYAHQREAQIAKAVIERVNGDFSSISLEEYRTIRSEEEAKYQDWWKTDYKPVQRIFKDYKSYEVK